MTAHQRGLVELASLLDRLGIPYMVIGGVANAVWGEPRATLDIDATLWVEDPNVASTIERITSVLAALVPDPAGFVAQTRVLPLQSGEGVRIDLIFGMLPFEEEAIRRAISIPVGGTAVRFCTPEDLILHKIVSERERDQADARGIVARRLAGLDLGYLEPRITELAKLLDRPAIEASWQAWKREAEESGPATNS